jgi:prophage regulatory protein
MNPTPPSKEEELLTLAEIVDWIKVSESTIYRWMDEGIFPRPLKLGAETKQSPMRWIRKDVSDWINTRPRTK